MGAGQEEAQDTGSTSQQMQEVMAGSNNVRNNQITSEPRDNQNGERQDNDTFDNNPIRERAPEMNGQFTMASEGRNIEDSARSDNEFAQTASVDNTNKTTDTPAQDFSM